MRVVVGCEDAVFNQRSHVFCAKFFSEAHIVVAFVGGEAPQVACVSQGDLRADVRPVRPLRATVNVDNRALRGIDEERRLDGLYLTITAAEIVT